MVIARNENAIHSLSIPSPRKTHHSYVLDYLYLPWESHLRSVVRRRNKSAGVLGYL